MKQKIITTFKQTKELTNTDPCTLDEKCANVNN